MLEKPRRLLVFLFPVISTWLKSQITLKRPHKHVEIVCWWWSDDYVEPLNMTTRRPRLVTMTIKFFCCMEKAIQDEFCVK